MMKGTDNIKITQMIFDKLSGKINAKDKQILTDWLNKDIDHQDYYLELKEIWDLSGVKSDSDPDTKERWDALENHINFHQKPELHNNLKFRSIAYTFMRIAALLAIGFGIWFLFIKEKPMISIESNHDLIAELLPDGSEVSLHNNSVLSYRKGLNDSLREVFLDGEAFFNVKSDKHRPFIIKTSNSKIEVTGTSFSVRAYPDEKTESVIVESGSVIVSSTDRQGVNYRLDLKPGEKALYDKKSRRLQKESNKDKNYLAWINHKFYFDEASIDEFSSCLKSNFNKNIVVSDSVIYKYKISAVFKEKSLEEILKRMNTEFAEILQEDKQYFMIME